MEGVITEARPRGAGAGVPAPQRAFPAWIPEPGVTEGLPLGALRSGIVPGLVVSGHLVPDPLPEDLALTVLGPGDRRRVLIGGGALGDLPAGARISVPDVRHAALLRALHPSLLPREGGDDAGHAIVPLWRDPTAEARGDLLDRDSWLPGPGEGIQVLVRRRGEDVPTSEDAPAAAVLAGERALAREFPGSLLSVRGQSFGAGIRFQALIVSSDGRRAVRGEAQGALARPEGVARELATLLERRGARLIPTIEAG